MSIFEDLVTQLSYVIYEPMTSFTDAVLAGISLYFFYCIFKLKSNVRFVNNWSLFFLFLGISTFFGALSHTIASRINNPYYDSTWLVMQLFSGIGVYFAQTATFRSEIKNETIRRYLMQASLIQLILFIPAILYFFSFKVVALNSTIALLELIIIYTSSMLKYRDYKVLILAGFLISCITVYVHQQKLSFTWWFNHNDIAHSIMIMSVMFIYNGVKYQNRKDTLLLRQKE